MPRIRARKTNRGLVGPEVYDRAWQSVTSGQSIRAAAKMHGVCNVTLMRYVKRRSKDDAAPPPGYRSHNKVFTEEQEALLKQRLTQASDAFFGVNAKVARVLAYQLAKQHGIKCPPSWEEHGMAGKDWYLNFKDRSQSLLTFWPKATSISRSPGFNSKNVGLFFSNLSSLFQQHNFQAKDVWNADETTIATAQAPDHNTHSHGKKQMGAVTSAQRGSLVTLALAVNAVGNYIPPHFVFPRKKFYQRFVRDGPVGCIGSCSGSGCMQEADFTLFLKHFVSHTKPTPDSKVLLLLDDDASHLSVEGFEYCQENGVVLFSFPPNCSHKLQPLEQSVFGPLKNGLSSAMDHWTTCHPDKTMSIYDLPSIVATALPSAATLENIMAGFECTGIWPLNPDIFTAVDFSKEYVTDCADPPELVASSPPVSPSAPSQVSPTSGHITATFASGVTAPKSESVGFASEAVAFATEAVAFATVASTFESETVGFDSEAAAPFSEAATFAFEAAAFASEAAAFARDAAAFAREAATFGSKAAVFGSKAAALATGAATFSTRQMTAAPASAVAGEGFSTESISPFH